MTAYRPLGVVGAITPWNSPIASDAQKIAPALAAGNAVVLKPAEITPLVSLEVARIAQAAGLPDGLLSVLPGKGSVAGNAIVVHPLVKKVSFTGGTATGRALAHAAAENLMPVTLELGGKSPTVVFADADLDHARNGVLFGIFSSQGQSCIAGSRLFVQRSIYEPFVDALVAHAKRLRVGDPLDPRTHLGPLISMEHRANVERYVELARAEGGTVLCGGRRPDDPALEQGSFYEPTIVAGLTNRAAVCQEEIFGPVLVVMPFDDEADLIEQANDTVYGLACGLWTADYKRAWRVGRAIEAGTVWVNTYKQFSIATPFAGFKESGIGREKGRDGIRSYLQEQSIYWGMNEEPLPWANLS
jgi:betaine-aldehyde dehydrogenase